MKKNSLIIILLLIIIILITYIIYDKYNTKDLSNNNLIEENISIIDTINLEYVSIYLTNDGNSYIVPINNEEIDKLSVGNNLKERLNTLYNRAFYYDVYLNSYKIKGFKVVVDKDIKSIRRIEINNDYYIIFIKENNKIALFNYEEYYNLLYTKVIDNYNNLDNVLDVKDNKIIYLDGSSKEFDLKK